jgi:alpha-L-fucosidase
VEKHVLDAWLKGEWAEISAHGAIGYKRIHRFKAVTTDKLRVRILEARAPATISTLSAHFYDEPPFPVQIRTDSNNRIDLVSGVVGRKGGFSSSKTQNIHYTLDGSDPTAASPVYSQRISLPDGGIIKARTITNGRLGVMTTKLLGLPRAKWQVVATDSIYDERRNQPGKALDGRSHAWLSSDAEGEHFFTVDMGRKLSCIGFTYTPPQDKNKRGCIESYRFEGSGDGTTWQVVKSGTLGNIINDPSKRIIHFEDSETFRYFKLIGVKAAQGNMMGIDEIQILGRKQ